MFKCFLLNLIFLDYSIWYDIDEDSTYFNYNTFIYRLNIISHRINILPIILNFWILLNDSTNNYLYIFSIAYAFFHMTLNDFLLNLNLKKNKSTIIAHIYRIIMNSAKKVSFYMIISDLISYHLAFISIYSIFLAYEFYVFKMDRYNK